VLKGLEDHIAHREELVNKVNLIEPLEVVGDHADPEE
jgi:hypothetical protein